MYFMHKLQGKLRDDCKRKNDCPKGYDCYDGRCEERVCQDDQDCKIHRFLPFNPSYQQTRTLSHFDWYVNVFSVQIFHSCLLFPKMNMDHKLSVTLVGNTLSGDNRP